LRIVVALTLLAGSASAQSAPSRAPAAPLSESLQGPAKDAYESGKLLTTNRDFVGALAKFQQAYDSSGDPRLLYNMAVCNKELRHYARMKSLLQRYAHDAGQSMSAENRVAVDQALAAIGPLVATVTLDVSPPAASVLVDGAPVGTAPLSEALVLDLGKHTITVEKSGFQTSEQTIDAPGGGSLPLTISLVAQKHIGQLVITSDEDATVIVDDKIVGKGRFDGSFEPGPHEVRVTEPGKTPFASQVDLRDGATRTIDVSLESAEHRAAIWPWVVGGVVVAAGAVVGGYFLFKPQDETAAPPVGKLGQGQVNFSAFGFR
jgi:PEGA domain